MYFSEQHAAKLYILGMCECVYVMQVMVTICVLKYFFVLSHFVIRLHQNIDFYLPTQEGGGGRIYRYVKMLLCRTLPSCCLKELCSVQ